MRRGDLVTIAVSGDNGKPRPALIVQSDAFAFLSSVTVLRLSSDIHPAHLTRVLVEPTPENGLRVRSHIVIDKAAAVPRTKVGRTIGRLDAATQASIDRALAAFLSLT